ncbi:MAG: energy transducer TonB [Nitrospiraceae bacterium]|nr:energy transducer TonB [Nitrospiraceae bacterium]
MPPRLHFTKFLIASLALHALVIAAVVFLFKPSLTEIPVFTPVRIVNLPQQETRQLPPLQRPAPPPSVPERIIPEKPFPPNAVPIPKKFGESDEVKLPKTLPRTGVPEGAEQGKAAGKATTPLSQKQTGPLPFLTQNDIDELARKGMPEKSPGDDSVTLDTDEFKFMSYNRWLKIKVESVLKYPDLAAISGYQGSLFIKFDILKDGALGGVEVLKSSGYKILDDEAVRAIRAAAPFQPLPDDWGMQRYTIRAAVIFYLGVGYIR